MANRPSTALIRRSPPFAHRRARVSLFAACVVASLCVIAAQQPFRATVDLVSVYATVTGADGAYAAGLRAEDFVVLDDGAPQAIVSFSDVAQTISVSVLLDTSSSMAQARPRLFAAASTFLDQLRPDDRARVGSLVFQGPPFTDDKARLRTSLDLLPSDPASPVWAALDRSLAALADETNRRVIVIYTDGRNRELPSPRPRGAVRMPAPPTEASIRARAEAQSVMIYAVGFEGVPLSGGIRAIAQRSGGRATELKRTDDLGQALAAVADELHHQYLLGFKPPALDGRTHQLTVRVRPAGLSVRARQTYVARRADR